MGSLGETAPTEVDRDPVGDGRGPDTDPVPAEGQGPGGPVTGRVLGRFRVLERLGAGGLGEVYRAEQELLGRTAVIKVMRRDRPVTASRAERFLREARMAARLDHPYAAHVYAFGAEPDGLLWIAMELVRGRTLSEMVRERGPLPLELFAPLAGALCEVVHAAHELGIVHRDIKPSNVMVVASGDRLLPKLLDFGVAKLLDDVDSAGEGGGAGAGAAAGGEDAPAGLTREDGVLGTPLYMAPEQWATPAQVDRRADVYALGALGYFCLTGRPPFPGDKPEEVARAHAGAVPPRVGGSAPPALEDALARALAKRPADRFATALELGAALAAAAAGMTAPPSLDAGVADRWIARAPEPLAEMVSALVGARTLGEADSLAHALVDALGRWLAVLALAARRAPDDLGGLTLPEHACELGKALLRRGLEPAEWLRLARTLVVPPDPLAELVGGPGADALAELCGPRDPLPPGPALRARLAADMSRLDRALDGLSPLLEATVVGEADGTPVQLAGLRRRRPAILWGAPLEPGTVILIGLGRARLSLAPLVAFGPGLPGGEPEVFALASGTRGPCLRALPSGAELPGGEAARAVADALGLPHEAFGRGSGEVAPYLGLAPFSAADSSRFVGRERETHAFVNLVRARRLAALVGASGAGKSSFLHAGVLPLLPDGWRSVSLRPGSDPIRSLIMATGLELPPGAPAADLAAALVARAGRGTLVVAVDQMEELFALGAPPEERVRFAAALVAAADAPGGAVRVVLCMRDDFLARAEALEPLRGRLAGGLMLLITPATDELRRIVAEPARRAGYRFEDPRLIDEMVGAMAERPGGLALLAFTALAWWERRDQERKVLPSAAYQELGGVAGALAAHAEALYAGLAPGAQQAAREVVRHLVTAEGTRASLPAADLARLAGPGGADAVDALIDGRLLVAREDGSGAGAVELAHEALIEAWPLLRRVREEDAALARLRDELRAAARLWTERGRREDELWRGRALAELERFRGAAGVRLTEAEESFADASRQLAGRTRRRRQALAVGAAVAAAVALLAMAISERSARRSEERAQRMAVQAATEEAEAADRLAEMWLREGRRESATGSALRGLAYLQGAYGRIDGPGIRYAIARAMLPIDQERAALRGHGAAVRGLVWSQDGRQLASIDDSFGLRHWRFDGGRAAPAGELPEDAGSFAGFNADGSLLAIYVWDEPQHISLRSTESDRLEEVRRIPLPSVPKEIRVDVRTIAGDTALLYWRQDGQIAVLEPSGAVRRTIEVGQRFRYVVTSRSGDRAIALLPAGMVLIDLRDGTTRTVGGRLEFTNLHMSHDGAVVATGSPQGITRVYDWSTGRLLHELSGHTGRHIVALSPDGRLVASGGTDRTARVWSVADGRLIATLAEHRGPIAELLFDPASEILATASGDGAVRLYSKSGGLLATYEGHAADVLSLGWAPSSDWLASGGADGVVKLWHSRELETRELAGGGGELEYLVSCGDSVAGAERRHVALYDLETGAVRRRIEVGAEVIAVACSDRAGRVMVGLEDGARLYDLEGTLVARLDAHDGAPVPEGVFTRDGALLATVGMDGTLQVWEAASGAARTRITGDEQNRAYPSALEFDAAGQHLLVGDSSGKVMEWRVSDGGETRRAQVHRSTVVALRLSPDGRTMAAASADRAVSLVRMADLVTERTIEEHAALITSLAWNPRGELLATGSEDPAAFVWEAATGALVGEVRPGAGGVAGVVFAGDRLVAASRGGRVMSYPAHLERRSPEAIRALLGCRLPFRLGPRGIERIVPGGEGCQ